MKESRRVSGGRDPALTASARHTWRASIQAGLDFAQAPPEAPAPVADGLPDFLRGDETAKK
jgi:hypothetical protein